MNILSISFDQAIFDKKSDSFSRQKFYASCVDSYTIIVFTLSRVEKLRVSYKKLQVIPTNSFSRWLYPLDALRIAWGLRKEKFSLVTVQDPFMAGIAGTLIRFILKIPLNIQIHSEFFNSKYFREENLFNRFLYHFGLFNLNFSDSVRARNKRIKEDIIMRYPHLGNKVRYVGVRISEVFLAPLSKTKRDQNLIISVGRFAKQKNLPLLISAVASLVHDFPKLQLVLIGDGEEKNSLVNMVKVLGLQNNICFVGWEKPSGLKKLYDRAGIFVLSSNHEGWALVVLEALARGCPVVMTNTGCAEEIVVENETGCVVPIGSKAKLVERIKVVLDNYEHYKNLALKGRILVLQDSSLSRIKQDMLSLWSITCEQSIN